MADTLSLYRRRPKCLAPALEDEKENEKHINVPLTTMENHVSRSSRGNKGRFSWIDRSLSSRININKVKADTFSSRRGNDKAKQITSPNLHRKKRVEAPADFVREQRTYFDQVDAFELEEESPPSKESWIPKLHQEDAGDLQSQFHWKGLLQAVQEDTPEDLQNNISHCGMSSHDDPLSQILRMPESSRAMQSLVSRKQLQISKQGCEECTHITKGVSLAAHEISPSRNVVLDVETKRQPVLYLSAQRSLPCIVQVDPDLKPVCKGLVTSMESIPTIIISSDDEDGELLKENEASRTTQSGVRAINLDDSPIPVDKDCKTHFFDKSIKCECHRIPSNRKKAPKNKTKADVSIKRLTAGLVAESRRTSVCSDQLPCKADESFVKEIERLNIQANKDIVLDHVELPNLEALLQKCGQTVPMQLEEAIMQFSKVGDVRKLGEGTYGEAFRASSLVFKIVPMGGNFRVNGEIQKSFAEMYTEMVLTLTLNRLRRQSRSASNSQRNVCNNFIETKMVKVCKGIYGQTLSNAWEEWDIKHGSENDHPKVFPKNQLYMLFVLEDGGKDLESFSIASFDVARSILTQVTTALAIAEEDCEFEHRDLHWGNILVAQTDLSELQCTLNGSNMQISTCGVFVHIIDFTLSRLSTGKEVLFSNLSDDPLLFKGPKGDIQAETYRKMLLLTNGFWDKRFSKTNCYWVHYLIDILLTKKKFPCSPQESRALRALKKRVLCYESARACLLDDFFVINRKH